MTDPATLAIRGGRALACAIARPDALRGLGAAWARAEHRLTGEARARPRAARGLGERFVRLAAACGEPEAVGRAHRLRGAVLAMANDYAGAAAEFEFSQERLSGRARDGARVGRAAALLRLGRRDEAVALLRRVRSAAQRRGDDAVQGAAELNLAVATHEGGDPRAALGLYGGARTHLVAAGRARDAALALQNHANALVLLDRAAQAESLYAEAMRELDDLGLAAESAWCAYNRGTLLVATDRLGEAEAVLADAEARLRRVGEPVDASLARLDRGEALLRARLVPEAITTLRSARKGLARRAPPVERARATLLLARAHLAAGEPRTACRLLAGPLAQEDAAARAEREEILGRARAESGDPAGGRERLLSAARGFGADRPGSRARALVAAAACARAAGDPGGARRALARAARDLDALALPALLHGAEAVRFLVEADAGNRQAADTALSAALTALESLRAGLGPDRMRAALLGGAEGWFARAVRHVLEGPGGAVAALRMVERWRARALVDLLGDAARLEEPSERLAALQTRVRLLESRLGGRPLPALLRIAPSPDRDASLRTARELRGAEEELRHEVERAAPPAGSGAVDPSALARRLPVGTVVLVLFTDAERTLVFCVCRGSVAVREVAAPRSRIAALVEELRFRLGKFELGAPVVDRQRARIAAETDRVLSDLAAVCLLPAADAVRAATRVVVVPDGPWHGVPFAALPFDGQPLVARRAVVLAPALAVLSSRIPAARGRPLVVAHADECAPAIAEEGRAVAEVLPGARLAAEGEATWEAVAGGRRPSCLHVAAHGRLRSDAPAMSGVLLADGWARALEFRRLPLDGSLVVLSGCSTGAAAVGAGGEVQGLVRGVLASGAAELVVSLWPVADEPTARFMAAFHGARARGEPTEQALRAVQARLAAEGLHPWHWAGFTLWTRRIHSGME